MSRKTLEFQPEAWLEVEASAAWYRERDPDAGLAFVRQVQVAARRIVEAPEQWPRYGEHARRILVTGYPFALMYRVLETRIVVLAVAHTSRRPGYWRER